MTADEYRAALAALGLRPTQAHGEKSRIYSTVRGEPYSVDDPEWQTAEQRAETIERLKVLMGVSLPLYRGPTR